MAVRPFTLADASTRPALWLDGQDASRVFVDANNRVQAVGGKGTANESYIPLTSARAPLYTSTAFGGVLPGFKFTATRADLLRTTTSAPQQPSTIVLVWQTGPTRKNYEVVLSTDNANTDPKLNVFGSFGNGKILISPPGASGGGIAASVGLNGFNVLIIQNNGAASRYYYNGVVTAFDQGTATISRNGVDIGGLFNDTATPFDGVYGEVGFLPSAPVGDEWDRITQGSSWRWGQQAHIAAGSTYKDAGPTVTIVAAAPDSGVSYSAATAPSLAARSLLVPAGASSASASAVPSLSARAQLTPDSGALASFVTSPALAVAGVLGVDSATAVTLATVAALANSRAQLAPASCAIATVATAATLSFRVSIAPASASLSSVASVPSLTPGYGLSAAGASSATVATLAALSARSQLAPINVELSTVATSPGLLNVRASLAVNSASLATVATEADMRVSMKWPTPALPGMKATLIIPPRFATLTIGK